MLAKVVIFGRPNVGKSTLFNRMAKRRAAIVENISGVTRDSVSTKILRSEAKYMLYDTAGFCDPNFKDNLSMDIQNSLALTVKHADLVLFIIDAKNGIVPEDLNSAEFLRKVSAKVFLIANKAESRVQENLEFESNKLGFGEALLLSATHNRNLNILEEKIIKTIKDIDSNPEVLKAINTEENVTKFRLAIVGRPNCGKSTLFNCFLGKNRVLTGNKPGTTRDSITEEVLSNNMNIEVIDTAGMRRESKIKDSIEEKSIGSTLNSIKYAQIILVLLDGSKTLSKQDLSIASYVAKEGRGLIIAINKWDLVKNKSEIKKNIREKIDSSLSQVKGVEVIEVSAMKNKGLDKLFLKISDIYKKWNYKIETSKLNEWLKIAQNKNPPPLKSGKVVKIKYCSQINIRPPTFVFFINKEKGITRSYQRYLLNNLRDNFNLNGVPIRIIYRKQENPYIKK